MSGTFPTLIELSTNEKAIAEKNIPDAKEEMFALALEEYFINIGTTLPIKNAEDTIAEKIMLCPNSVIFRKLSISSLHPKIEKRKIFLHQDSIMIVLVNRFLSKYKQFFICLPTSYSR
jgi:hypothetical protein